MEAPAIFVMAGAFCFALGLHYFDSKESIEDRLRLGKSKVNFVFALGLHYFDSKESIEDRLRLGKSKVNFVFALGLHYLCFKKLNRRSATPRHNQVNLLLHSVCTVFAAKNQNESEK